MPWKIIKRVAAVILLIIAGYLCLSYGVYLGANSEYKRYDYTKLPNSCFLEALIHSSRASLVLKSEVNPKVFSSIFGYTFTYNDNPVKLSDGTVMTFGHAICIFEYKNKLWAYDMNYGTMLVCKAGDRNEYASRLKIWIESTRNVKIQKCFVVDDWALPSDFIK